jgi:hypothetical protein
MRKFIVGSAISVVLCAVYIAVILITDVFNHNSSSTTLNVVQQPASAAAVAQQAGCSSFSDKGPSTSGGVVDSGTCKISTLKYGVDTFANKDARDSWLTMAAKYGVTPKWETDTSVVYVSIDQTA